MKKLYFVLLCVIFQLTYSQDVTFTGDITVTTQAEVDALSEQYTHITGRLDILGGDGDISDLSKFSDLREIGRRLLIQDCPLVTDLTGFSALEAIGSLDANEELVVRRMDGLTTLNGLQALTSVGRRVGIRQNPVLVTLEGLNNLQTIGENKITIGTCGNDAEGNPMLVDYCALQGLIQTVGIVNLEEGGSCIDSYSIFNPTFQDILDGNCTSIFTGDITVATQAEVDALPIQYTQITGRLNILAGDISDLSKFSQLREIGRRLLIQDCPLITDLTGFTSLEAIGSLDPNEEFVVRRMDGLTTLNGLQSLISVGRRVGIRQNPVLTTLEGLNNLQIIGENKITIGDDDCDETDGEDLGNDMLTDYCALQGLVNTIGVSTLEAGGSCIVNNATFNPTFQNIADGICSASLSISNINGASYSLYPNPVLNSLNIKSDIRLDAITIINALGMEVLKTQETKIDVSGLKSGLYFVKIDSGNKSSIEKFIKY